jgi:hypothetical protein
MLYLPPVHQKYMAELGRNLKRSELGRNHNRSELGRNHNRSELGCNHNRSKKYTKQEPECLTAARRDWDFTTFILSSNREFAEN